MTKFITSCVYIYFCNIVVSALSSPNTANRGNERGRGRGGRGSFGRAGYNNRGGFQRGSRGFGRGRGRGLLDRKNKNTETFFVYMIKILFTLVFRPWC